MGVFEKVQEAGVLGDPCSGIDVVKSNDTERDYK